MTEDIPEDVFLKDLVTFGKRQRVTKQVEEKIKFSCFKFPSGKETEKYGTDFWTLWERARLGFFKRTASKHVYYQG